jgi:ABC-2 type transport system permease protein
MTPRIAASTARRILLQLSHDHRTIALVVAVPSVLLTLLHFMYDATPARFDHVALVMLGVFPFLLMFLVTSIAMLRERTIGTLERMFTTPVRRADLLIGYAIAFGVLAALQATITTAVATGVLGLDTEGPLWVVVGLAIVNGFVGVSLGLGLSAFASSEFQAVQFMPVVGLPQMLLCGLFVPREDMVDWLRVLSDLMPLSYAVEALEEVATHSSTTSLIYTDAAIVAGVGLVALVLGAVTLRRQT